MSLPDFTLIAPQLIVLVTALIIPALYFLTKNDKVVGLVSISGVLLSGAYLAWMIIDGVSGDFLSVYAVDDFSLLLTGLFLTVVFLVLLSSLNTVERDHHHGEYYALLLTATSGMMFVACAQDLIGLFVGLELTSMSSYALVAFRKNDPRAAEAATKYLVIGGLSTAMTLYGFSLLYGMTQSTMFVDIAAAIGSAPTAGLMISMALIIAGLGFKVTTVPFHMWAPDVYEGAVTPISTFLAVGSKKMGFVALFKVFLIGFIAAQATVVTDMQYIFAALAAITMTLGNVVVLSQTNIKRMLAYSSIAQAGYLLIVLAVATPYALTGGILHMITHVFMKGGAFIIVAALAYVAVGERIDDYKGLARRAPLVAFSMLIFLFSLAGVPPLAGFVSKFVLFSSGVGEPGAALSGEWVWLIFLAVINSAISLYYYARVVKYMYVDEGETSERIKVPVPFMIAILICLVAVIGIGLFPEPLISLCESAAAALMN